MLGSLQILAQTGVPTPKAPQTEAGIPAWPATAFDAVFELAPELTSADLKTTTTAGPAPDTAIRGPQIEPTSHDHPPSAAHHRHLTTLTLESHLALPPAAPDVAMGPESDEVQDDSAPTGAAKALPTDEPVAVPVPTCLLTPGAALPSVQIPISVQTAPAETSIRPEAQTFASDQHEQRSVQGTLPADPHHNVEPEARIDRDVVIAQQNPSQIPKAEAIPPEGPANLLRAPGVDLPLPPASPPSAGPLSAPDVDAAVPITELGQTAADTAIYPPIAMVPAHTSAAQSEAIPTRARPTPAASEPAQDLAEKAQPLPEAKPVMLPNVPNRPEPAKVDRAGVSDLPAQVDIDQALRYPAAIARPTKLNAAPVFTLHPAVQGAGSDAVAVSAHAPDSVGPISVTTSDVTSEDTRPIQNGPDEPTIAAIRPPRYPATSEPVSIGADLGNAPKSTSPDIVPVRSNREPDLPGPLVPQAPVKATVNPMGAEVLSAALQTQITRPNLPILKGPAPTQDMIEIPISAPQGMTLTAATPQTFSFAAQPDAIPLALTQRPTTTALRVGDALIRPSRSAVPDPPAIRLSVLTPAQALSQFQTMLDRVPNAGLATAAPLTAPMPARDPAAITPTPPVLTGSGPAQPLSKLPSPVIHPPFAASSDAFLAEMPVATATEPDRSPAPEPTMQGSVRISSGHLQSKTAAPGLPEGKLAESEATKPARLAPIAATSPKFRAAGLSPSTIEASFALAPSSARTTEPEVLTAPLHKPLAQPLAGSSIPADASPSPVVVKADRIVDPALIGPERAALLQPELPVHEATPSPTFSPASLVRSFSQMPVSKSLDWAATVRATPTHLGQQQPQTSRAVVVPQAANSKSHIRDAPASAALVDSEIIPAGPDAVQPPGLGAGLLPVAQPLTRSTFSLQLQSLPPAEMPTGAALATPDRASRALPKGFSTNLARSIGETGHGRAELILEPAELGRLRFDIVTQGDKVQINLAVERPETLTLLRNHADELRQEFRDAGFTGGTLNFSQWGQQEEGKAPPELAQGDITPHDLMPTEPAPASRPRTASDGLDLRL